MNTLNESQYNAVMYNSGPSLIIAGAGSGKTRVLTYKVAQLLREGYIPNSILVLTFTNKAAKEMKSRITDMVEPSLALMIDAIAGATVEALCNKLCAGCFETEPQRRFSPGYGDFPLDYQRKIVETLSAPLNIGVNLTSSVMLTPTKSVTAVVPLKGCI